MKKKELEDILEELYEENDSLKNEVTRIAVVNSKLLSLIGVTSIIASSLDKTQVLKSILDQTKLLMECHHSSVLLVDPVTNKLYFEVLSNEEDMAALKDIRLKKGEGIAGTVWKTGQPLIIDNAFKDKRFSNKADKKLDTTTKSIIAVPLIFEGKVIGVMEAMNKYDETSFNRLDLEIFKTLSTQAAIAIYNAKLYEMAITDGLTKLFIHKYFYRRLREEYVRAKRYERDVSVIMFDIDHFKKFNDNYGHRLGDEVLIRTADIIQENCRGCDIAARYGGEEFAVILTETGKDGGLELAERIRNIIEKTKIKFKNEVLSLTISAGIASFSINNPESADNLLEMADKALYFSKNNGRNKVTFYDSELIK